MTYTVEPQVLQAAQELQSIELTTIGRVSGKPHRIIVSIGTMGGRLFVASRAGMGRDWTQNLAANGRGILHLDGLDVPFIGRHLDDMAEARQVTLARAAKYGSSLDPEDEGRVLPIETATFEAVPVPAFPPEIFRQLSETNEITLETRGRRTGNPARVITWITPAAGSLFIMSGGGLGRDWTRNVQALPEAVVLADGLELPVSLRHVTRLPEAKAVTRACVVKYGNSVYQAPENVASPAETATFEVTPRVG